MMYMPEGQAAGEMDRITLLAMWSRHLQSQGRTMIAACMGKPTFAMNGYAASLAAKHWSDIQFLAQESHHLFRNNPDSSLTRDTLVKMGGAIDYGEPQGDRAAREVMAKALTRWYNNQITVKPQHLLFTVGGAGAIHLILEVLYEQSPAAQIITPFPHYTLYATTNKHIQLHPIPVMEEPGYRLSAQSLEASINALKTHPIGAFLFCSPNNPLGTITSPDEWRAIAAILKQHPRVPIILDEAYAELCLNGEHYQSLLERAPELYSRIILLRSATKALSAAGQRMAVLVTPDSAFMAKLLAKNVSMYGHAPRSDQKIFAAALYHFSEKDRRDLAAFYAPQVTLAFSRLQAMGVMMPDSHYKVEGAFYVLANLSELFGVEIPL